MENVQELLAPREIPRRKLINAGIAQQHFRRSVLEAAGEICNEFANHYWKEVAEGGDPEEQRQLPPPTKTESLKKGFVVYLNASGRYLVVREHLRTAVANIVQQRCMNIRPSGFQSQRDFQIFLHDTYNYLIDEVHEALSRTVLPEVDPLNPVPLPPKSICNPNLPLSTREMQHKKLLRELLFFSEECFALGDYDNSHRLHLQRICRSKEHPDCWTEFALMWLNRGEDRMAEIAIREALRQDSSSIYALLVTGLLAIRQNDERGIDCIVAALDKRPSCPELLVILGLALAIIPSGDELESDYFFRKAAHVHHILIGKPVGDLDKVLDKISKVIGNKEAVMDIEKAEAAHPSPFAPPQPKEPVEEEEEEVEHKIGVGVDEREKEQGQGEDNVLGARGRKSIKKKRQSAKKESKASIGRVPAMVADAESKKTLTRMDLNSQQSKQGENQNPTGHSISEVSSSPHQLHQHPVTPDLHHHSGSEDIPSYDFTTELENMNIQDSFMPVLRPSLMIPWNVTSFTEKLQEILSIVPTEDKSIGPDDPISSPEEPPLESDEIIAAEYDKLDDKGKRLKSRVSKRDVRKISSGSRNQNPRSKSQPQPPSPTQVQFQRISESKQGDKNQNQKVSNSEEFEEISASGPGPGQTSGESENAGAGAGDAAMLNVMVDGQQVQFKSHEAYRRAMLEREPMPMYTDRLGSELIWTAQLLLQLRMFDMLDGVLTRELYVTETRSIQFIYLRAMSLYLRKCYMETIPYLDEGIAMDPDNPVFSMLKGHCYYEAGDLASAVEYYEATLKLPSRKENRHLLYLRYGTMALDAGSIDSAKRTFLYGLQKYPTPYLWLAVGNTCYIREEYEEAEAAFSEANRLDSTSPFTWAQLTLVNLMLGRPALAEQSYKWAIRFGLKKGKILDEIKKLQQDKGFGDPSFPTVPDCIPNEYFVRRFGRQKPFEIYRDALFHDFPNMGKTPEENTSRENELKERLRTESQGESKIPLDVSAGGGEAQEKSDPENLEQEEGQENPADPGNETEGGNSDGTANENPDELNPPEPPVVEKKSVHDKDKEKEKDTTGTKEGRKKRDKKEKEKDNKRLSMKVSNTRPQAHGSSTSMIREQPPQPQPEVSVSKTQMQRKASNSGPPVKKSSDTASATLSAAVAGIMRQASADQQP